MSDSKRQDQRGASEHTHLPQEAKRHSEGATAGAEHAARPGADAQEVSHVGRTDGQRETSMLDVWRRVEFFQHLI